MKEAELLRECLDYLKLIGLNPVRMSNHAVMRLDRRTGRTFRAFHGARGMPDVFFVGPGGIAWFIELKTAKGKLSADQQAFHDNASRRGAVCLVVRSLDDMMSALRDAGVLPY